MKKLALVLVASTIALGATQANIGTGFYAGGAIGYGRASGTYSISVNPGVAALPGSVDFGGNSGNIGIHGGYGWVDNCLYFGGELGYTFDNTRINNTQAFGFPQNGIPGVVGGTSLKRSGYFSFAARGGYLFTPTTMLYLRLGSNWGRWTLRDAGNFASATFGTGLIGYGSSKSLSFVPGVGIETALNKNLYLRGEYTYEFGPSLRAINANQTGSTNIGSIRTQSGKLGLSYRFLSGKDTPVVVASYGPQTNITTGYYLGSALGYGGLTAKYMQRGLSQTANDVPGVADFSGRSGNIGIHGGYGLVTNCLYIGGEVAYTFDNSQINNTIGIGDGLNAGTYLKRNGYFNASARGGYLVTPATMLYIRLGANWGKWTFVDSGNNFGNFLPNVVGYGSKNRMTFVPGLGLETGVARNVYLRVEYTYEFCPSIQATNVATDGYTTYYNLRSQTGKLGLSYKF